MSRREGKKRRNEGNVERRKSPRFIDSQKKGEINRNKQCKKHSLTVASTDPQEQVAEKLIGGSHSTDNERWVPDKQILKQILDTLQRRDTHEIFAEPVDPSEVEEYYEIIKEPMDFGTMRAKLHEGMYKTLQQFERDVFLIFDNAIHFNSSTTVYFRQARALEELAKRIFHVLRTDPKNFEVEFVITRKRSCRGGTLNYSDDQSSKPAFTLDVSQKLDRDFQSNTNTGKRAGCKKERRASVTETDRRSAYKPWTSIDDKFSLIHDSQKSLIQVNDGEEIGYEKSLMLFVKDLGPTAQRVAKRKLQSLKQGLGFSRLPDNNNANIKIQGFGDFTSKKDTNNVVGKFDLNKVVESDSSPNREDESMRNLGAFSSFPMYGQFTFDIPYLKSRMRELNDNLNVSHYSNSTLLMGNHNSIAWFN